MIGGPSAELLGQGPDWWGEAPARPRIFAGVNDRHQLTK